jgi:hypothetical protein
MIGKEKTADAGFSGIAGQHSHEDCSGRRLLFR